MLERIKYIITNEERVFKMLKLFKEFPNKTFNELHKLSKDRKIAHGGSFGELMTDIKTMKLATNGLRYNLSELGQNITNNPENRKLWKEACLNVPLYKEYYDNFFERNDQEHFVMWLIKTYNVKQPVLGRIPRRYLEMMFQARLPKRFWLPQNRNKKKEKIDIDKELQKFLNPSSKKEDDTFFTQLEVIKLLQMWENSSEEDRRLLRKLIKK